MTSSWRACFENCRVGFARSVDLLVKPFHLRDRIAFKRSLVEMRFPTNEQLAKLRAPIADVVVGDDSWPSSRKMRASESPRIVERMWPTCIGLATFGELKSTTTVRGETVFSKEQMFPARGRLQSFRDGSGFSRKFKKPAPAISTGSQRSDTFSFRDHVRGQLARVDLPRFGQGHQSVALVIAKFGVGAGADQD